MQLVSKTKYKDITIIIPLYKTPLKCIKIFNQYKKYQVIVLDQCPDKTVSKKIEKLDLEYYSSKKNLGLSKATSFLLSKVKTKYCLFTQADIEINSQSIKLLKYAMLLKRNIIFAGPEFIKKKALDKKRKIFNSKTVKSLDAACMLCDVNKLRKIGFFDEDFFLYWEDIYLMHKINKSKFKMLFVPRAKAIHGGGKSTENNFKVKFIRTSNFKYGEFLYDYKLKKFKVIKIVRQFIQNLFFLFLNTLLLNTNKVLKNLAFLTGIYKFLKFYFLKNFFFIKFINKI